jgi:hypothetical protein
VRGTGRACTDDRRYGTAGRGRPRTKPVGRPAVGVRGPSCLTRTVACRPRWFPGVAKIGGDRVRCGVPPRPSPRRLSGGGSRGEAAPQQHRGEQPEQGANHQDDPHGVEVEPGGTANIHGKVRIAPITNKKMLKPIPPLRLLKDSDSAVRLPIGRSCRPLRERRSLSGRYDPNSTRPDRELPSLWGGADGRPQPGTDFLLGSRPRPPVPGHRAWPPAWWRATLGTLQRPGRLGRWGRHRAASRPGPGPPLPWVETSSP